MKKNDLAVIILAAGKSTRMKSILPKAAHLLCSRPLINYVLDLAKSLKPAKTAVVLGYGYAQVAQLLPEAVLRVKQKKLLGTADAVKEGMRALKGFTGTVLVLYADNPLLKEKTLKDLIKYHQDNDCAVTLLTADMDKPQGYGRILRDKYSCICGIVEEKDADDFQKNIKEINTGIMCFKAKDLARSLAKVRPNNKKKEYYLTDVIGIIYKNARLTGNIKTSDVNEALGVNSRIELAKANKIMQARINEEVMKKGVTIISPDTTFISYGAKIGQDSVIYPFTVIEKSVKIGKHCSVGPCSHLREGTIIGNNVVVGNFVESVRSSIKSGTFVKHFSYLGDASLGQNVNIGAGTVIANFDGKNKHNTTIGKNAFIGSDSVLVSPVTIGNSARTGAGSVVVKTKVPSGKTVVGVPAKLLKKR
ncbi:MAG: NTP transferase domain-containing protein [Candidatus Omnitrophica bacterium]|jgi:bifunctional UDP-N-acetylglucosamine pyrophosphorylase/glucosamine-1-phosphate N-acetyltransferase|nr:NTP transferase domain-containing protein [Candidatus Omnitrophota bacterium]